VIALNSELVLREVKSEHHYKLKDKDDRKYYHAPIGRGQLFFTFDEC
jgi:hypothetical protein